MIDLTVAYIVSQIITVIFYGLFAYSYLLKTQRSILVVGAIAVILNAVAFILLGGWSGVAMCAIALARNLVCYRFKSFGSSRWFLLIVFGAIIIATIPTFDSFWSLMSVFATCVYSYSVWQKKPIVYKLCGLPVGVLWIIYNIYILSVFGVILEIALTIFALVGFIKDFKSLNSREAPTK
ncbi:MAG: YgjV family protein [Candidatus Nomurabacteria bacterium]|jgi:hypothetical protein|nr:YgjV family protein [Candidatus Nomurabacteria bacterium]